MSSEDKSSPTVVEQAEHIGAFLLDTPEEVAAQKSLVRKLDFIILPLLSLSYLMAYIDRNNIGYARLMGLQDGLKLSGSQFYNAVMVFYAGYIGLIFPASFLLRKLGPKVQLGFAVMTFGVFVTCYCAARGYADLIGLRFAVGGAEALLQSAPLYMVIWYGRHELGKRIAFFYSATTISGVFSGLIAYGIQTTMEGTGGRASWQWLFLIEGVIAITFGCLNAIALPSLPEKIKISRIFTPTELLVARKRSSEHNVKNPKFRADQVLASLKDPKTWLLALLTGCNSAILASTGAFLPTIVKEFRFSAVRAQLFTVIPYSVSFISMITIGYFSDRMRRKSYFIIGSLTSCLTGLIILVSTTSKAAGMFATSLLVGGAYPASVLQMAWIQINFCGNTKRATSWGVAMVFGQGLSMSGAQIYKDPPRFFMGHGVLIGYVAMGLVCTILARVLMVRDNRKRDEILQDYQTRGERHPDLDKDFEETCDKHISFRYIL
ncbi:hypothetical protein PV08_08802 [Exophiala spinifera]|uniref:Major facilitator superfamily (MFS) profile domain-containing protein n=1 Tax=Exophiala spinifera TaxID=91928 RepID=A0A0D1ZLC1_9EURO|nr:uncharacterized protein PV08_08802 [Exophiala spinifera]KIW13612.1 hypothetical protein PV08_08802 [Exophiala spinifera]